MKLHTSSTDGLNLFTAYGADYVAVNHQKHEKNLIVLPENIIEGWSTASIATLTADDDYFGSSLQAWRAAVASSSPTRYAFDPITFNEDVIIYATVTTAGNALSAAADITTIAQGIARGIK